MMAEFNIWNIKRDIKYFLTVSITIEISTARSPCHVLTVSK
jgi:hypothetical protein